MNLIEGQDNRVEQYLFHFPLPKDLEACIAAWVVICDFVELKKEHGITPQVFIEGLPDEMNWLPDWNEQWLDRLHIPEDYTPLMEEQEEQEDQWDLEFTFDVERAYRISEATGKHIVHAFGLLLGCEPETVFPKLDHVVSLKNQSEDSILCHSAYNLDSAVLDKTGLFPSPNLQTRAITQATSIEDMLKLVASASVVIAERSVTTYIASALGKKVIEFYPSDRHRGWLSKWSNENYRMFYGNRPEMFVEQLPKILKSFKLVA